MKTKIGKSIVSMVLAAVMCLSLLPMSAFAAEDGRPNGWMEVAKNVWHVDPETGYRYLIDDYYNIHWDISGPVIDGKEEQEEQEEQDGQEQEDQDKKEQEEQDRKEQEEQARKEQEERDRQEQEELDRQKQEERYRQEQQRKEDEARERRKQAELEDQQRGREEAEEKGIQLLEDKNGLYFFIENGVLTRYEFNPYELHVYGYMTQTEWVEAGEGINFDPKSVTEVVIPNSATSIKGGFRDYPNLKSITIPNSVTSIGERVFSDAKSLTSITIPNSVTSIGRGAFSGCTNLKDVTLSNRMTVIPDDAFAGCGIENFVIPDHITSIGSDACSSDVLKSLTIPASVTSIDKQLVRNVYGLTIYGVSGSAAETFVKEHNLVQSTGIGGNPIIFVATNGTAAPATPATPPTTEKPSAWAETQVNTAITENIVPQALQGQYTQATTRAEFCALAVALYEKVKGAEIAERQTFSDTDDINVQKAAAIGVVSGVGDRLFEPMEKLTREQAATMLSRLATAIGKPLAEQAATFADNDSISSWAVEAVGQMQASGIMGGIGNNTFASQDDYTREQSIATALRLYDIVK